MVASYNPHIKAYARKNRHQHNMTQAEGKLWNLGLKGDKLGYRFLRQKPLGNYILDFYCHKLGLCIEVDGSSHQYTYMKDLMRTKYLNMLGIRVIRYTNSDIYNRLELVIEDIVNTIKERESALGLNPPP